MFRADNQINTRQPNKDKNRFVASGHRDNMKNYLVHTSQTLQTRSERLMLALAAIFKFRIWTADNKFAYQESSEALSGRIFIYDAAAEFELEVRLCLEIVEPLYGLADSGDLWNKSLL